MPPGLDNDSWTNGGRYAGNTRFLGRLTYVNDRINIAALSQVASSLKGHIPCKVFEEFSAGNFNLVKMIEFEGGVRWVARMRMPRIAAFGSEGQVIDNGMLAWTDLDAQALASEVATMQLLRARTTIPIPEVYDFNTDANNTVGFPWILMSYVDGMTAFDLATAHGQPSRVPPQYYDHYVARMAKIMNQLASIRAPCLGSVYKLPLPGAKLTKDCMGPVAQTQTGPWASPAAFYREYPASLMKTLYGESRQSQIDSGGIETVHKFIQMFGSDEPPALEDEETDFGLVNLELGTHNVLVDKSFNILSVIDWDTTVAAPRGVCHHFPWCIGADPGLPGGESQVFKPLSGQREMTAAFCNAAAREAEHYSDPKRRRLFTVEEFYTKQALAFRGIAFFRVKQDWVDSEWKPALDWLEARSPDQIRAWYGF